MDSDDARAFLQTRLSLFWKVLFFIMLFATALALVGAFKKLGPDLFVDLALAAVAGSLWLLCRGGTRSVRFLRGVELGGSLLYFSGSSLLGRYVLIGFADERSIGTAEGLVMADAYMATLGLVGAALMVAIRAALVPSSPRRTLLYTAMVGIPVLLGPSLLAASDGTLVLRAKSSEIFPWLPAGQAIVWSFVLITCAVISRVIYGLRAEVREARRLGQYVLDSKIGEGGMGQVFRASHGMMRRPAAIKLLRPENTTDADLARFEREVQLTARLSHPNTITIYDYGRTGDGVFYYAMELLEGASLQRVVEAGGPLAVGRVVRILSMACAALTEAHGVGLIHRDIKPANIMLCRQGGERDIVKLLDFGLVKELAVDEDAGLSAAGTLTGTPQYMAPEAIVGESIDARADLYALGAVGYFLLAGSEVFTGRSVVEVLSRHLQNQPEPLSVRGAKVSAELEDIVRSCLAKDPADRPASAAELRKRLETCAVPAWGPADAEAWWREHAHILDSQGTSEIGIARTVAVAGHTRG